MDKEFEFEGERYLLSGNQILWKWDAVADIWQISAFLSVLKSPFSVVSDLSSTA